MTKRAQYGVILGLVSAIGCGGVENTSPTQPPPAVCDATSTDACTCSPSAFIACEGGESVMCNGQGDGITRQSCGAAGCTDGVGCNACVANTDSCNADFTAVEHCGTDSKIAQQEACAAGCITDSLGSRCQHIEPAWLGGVCDKPSTIVSAMSNTLDTDNDAACTGGIIGSDPAFCVVRAKTIEIAALKVTGSRAVAFVADDALTVNGTLDVSADGTTSGPGAGHVGDGTSTTAASYLGAGGAGFAQIGGRGGASDTGSPGFLGGSDSDRLTTDAFHGGARGGDSVCANGDVFCFNSVDFSGGGGGGGARLIACRGTVKVTGLVDAGGGGGQGGGDHYTSTAIGQGGAPGGGSGGFVAFEGIRVELTGQLYANGGGGGAGCNGDNCTGLAGTDGLRSTAGALGGHGPTATASCSGGIGGSVMSSPGIGSQTYANGAAGAGGGGGSMGRFIVLTPTTSAAIITPGAASPMPVASATKLDLK